MPTKFEEEYYGFVPKKDLKKFAKKHLTSNKYYDFIMKDANKQ